MIWTLKSAFSDQATADGIEILLNDSVMYVGMNFDTSDGNSTLKLKSNERYILNAGGGFDSSTGSPQMTATISEDQTTAIFTGGGWGDPLPDIIPYELGDVIAGGGGTGGDTVNDINRVYSLTPDEVKEVLNGDFKVPVSGGEFKDYSQFLLNLFYMPFDVSDKLGIQTTVKLKDLDTQISAYFINGDLLRFNMGTISVIGEFNNALDYANTITVLHLPYFKSINIEIDYVMNETLNIEYVFNVYNNQLTVNVSSTKIGGVILSESTTLDSKMPFTIDYIDTPTEGRNLAMSVDNGIKTPFVEVLRNEVSNSDGLFTIPVTDEGIINDFVGYVEVDNVDLNTTATSYEHQLINDVLKSGVILNV